MQPSTAPKAPFSAVIIAFNAARQIEPCLKSVAFADEVLVVDSGSDDETRAIAEVFGARVVEREWLGFGRQKQFAVSIAKHDWVLCLDVDERVSPELAESIRAAMANPDHMAYRMPRRNRFLGRWLAHGEGYPDRSLRLFHRAHAGWSNDDVHETVITTANVATLKGDLMHDSAEDVATYLAKQNHYSSLHAQALYGQGVRPQNISVAGIAGNGDTEFHVKQERPEQIGTIRQQYSVRYSVTSCISCHYSAR